MFTNFKKIILLFLVGFSLLSLISCESRVKLSSINHVQLVQGYKLSANDSQKTLIINYWASWCPPCRKEISELNEFYHNNKQHVLVLGVNLEKVTNADMLTVINDFKIDYPVYTKDIIKEQLNIDTLAYPATYVINKDGKLIKSIMGPVKAEVLEKYIS